MKDVSIVIKFLSALGLDVDRSKAYLALMQKGGLTVLQLSRQTGISRTTTYRLIDDLQRLGLIEEVTKNDKKLLYPVGTHKLELLVKEQETKTDTLKKLLPELSSYLSSDISLSQPGTKVLMYKGVEGIKQMVWNVLSAKSEVLGYTFRPIGEVVGVEFARKWKMEFVLRKLRFRDLVNENYDDSMKSSGFQNEESSFKTKVIPQETLEIVHQLDIYNEVVAYYAWHEEEIFGVEIYNARIAKLQRQLFELAWKESK